MATKSKSLFTVTPRRRSSKKAEAEIKTVVVRPKVSGNGIATQYLGQEGFEDVKACVVDNGKLKAIPKGLSTLGSSCMGYEIRVGEFLQIKHGDWVVTVPKITIPDWPFPLGNETLILSQDEFQRRYEIVE